MKLLTGFFLLALVPSCSADNPIPVHEVATSTASITQTCSLCVTDGVKDIAAKTSSGTLAGYFAIEVYNPSSSTNTVNCGFDLSLSTQIGSVWYGREVPAGVGVYFAAQSGRKLYCETQNSVGCTQLTITQMK